MILLRKCKAEGSFIFVMGFQGIISGVVSKKLPGRILLGQISASSSA